MRVVWLTSLIFLSLPLAAEEVTLTQLLARLDEGPALQQAAQQLQAAQAEQALREAEQGWSLFGSATGNTVPWIRLARRKPMMIMSARIISSACATPCWAASSARSRRSTAAVRRCSSNSCNRPCKRPSSACCCAAPMPIGGRRRPCSSGAANCRRRPVRRRPAWTPAGVPAGCAPRRRSSSNMPGGPCSVSAATARGNRPRRRACSPCWCLCPQPAQHAPKRCPVSRRACRPGKAR